jgi:hypothetical protein
MPRLWAKQLNLNQLPTVSGFWDGKNVMVVGCALGTVTGLVLSVIVIEVVNKQVGIVASCSGPGEGGMEP